MILDAVNALRTKLAGYSVLGEQKQWRERFATQRARYLLLAGASITVLLLFAAYASPVKYVDGRVRHKGPYVQYSLGSHWPGWSQTQRLLVFGDSWSTTSWWFGKSVPSIEEPMGLPAWPGETAGNGPNWVGYLTHQLNESVVLTADFAIGGATVVDMVHKDWRSMRSQIDDRFAEFNANYTSFWQADSTLMFLWIGINDIHSAFNTTAPFPPTLEVYSRLVETLYATGGKNFVFINVPPLSRSPYAKSAGVSVLWRDMVKQWNDGVEKLAWSFAARHKDVSLFFFDGWQLFNDIMDKPCVVPETCGFKITEEYCPMYSLGNVEWNTYNKQCPESADKYFWIDPLHPTTVLQNATAHAIRKAFLSSE